MKNLSPPLFFNHKERIFFLFFLLVVFFCNLSFLYYKFHKLKSEQTLQISAVVLLQYTKTKNNKSYFVLKLKSDFGTFYTTSKEDLKDLRGRKILLNVILNKVSFLDFLKSFYAPSFNLLLLRERDFREPLKNFIANQHETKMMGEYYLSLFLSEPLPLQWRILAQSYGIAHIFAISGYHTGILSAISFFLLGLLYVPLQKRYFPYRNRYFDLGFLVLMLLFGYYLLLAQSPSYLRALAMSAIGFFLLFKGLDILRLESFFWSVAILLAFFPYLAFSIGFYFSCLGVLYIFLFCKYFTFPKNLKGRILYAILLNASTFFLMGVVVYYFFPYFSPLSLFSLILTPLFSLYYPLVLFAHLLGFGGILDFVLLWWLNTAHSTIVLQPSFTFFIVCNLLTFFAIFYRYAFFTLLVLNLFYFTYGIFLST